MIIIVGFWLGYPCSNDLNHGIWDLSVGFPWSQNHLLWQTEIDRWSGDQRGGATLVTDLCHERGDSGRGEPIPQFHHHIRVAVPVDGEVQR